MNAPPRKVQGPAAFVWRYRVLLVLVGAVCGYFGPTFVRALCVPDEENTPRDFFQEWASARNYWEGQPIYGPQREAWRRYQGRELQGGAATESLFLDVNAHPPF